MAKQRSKKEYVYAQWKDTSGKEASDWDVFPKNSKDYIQSTASSILSKDKYIINDYGFASLTIFGKDFAREHRESLKKASSEIKKVSETPKKISEASDEDKEILRRFIESDDVFKKEESVVPKAKAKSSGIKKVKKRPVIIDTKAGTREGDIEGHEFDFLKGGTKIYNQSGEVKLDLKVSRDFLKKWKATANIFFNDTPIKLSVAMIFWKLVSDFTPYGEQREKALKRFVSNKQVKASARKNGRLTSKSNPDMPRDFLQEERDKRGIYKGVRKSIVNKLLQRVDKNKIAQAKDEYRYHMVEDVTIDSNGIEWHAPYSRIQFENPNGNFHYNQEHPFNTIEATRGSNWTGRGLNSGMLTSTLNETMDSAIGEYLNNYEKYKDKTIADVVKDRGFTSYN